MKDENNATTPVVENKPVADEEEKIVENTDKGGNKDNQDDNHVDYVKIRVERAKTQTTNAILKDLGANNIDEVKQRISDGAKALEEVQKLQARLEAQDKENELINKRGLLSKILDNEKVFDTDALLNYVDFDKVEIENGKIKDSDKIVQSLKENKPNFFGKYEIVSDNYIKGQSSQPKTALDKQKAGNNIGAINDYLKTILK